MLSKFLCWLVGHKWRILSNPLPFLAPTKQYCDRCGVTEPLVKPCAHNFEELDPVTHIYCTKCGLIKEVAEIAD